MSIRTCAGSPGARTACLALALTLLGWAQPARASSLPRADFGSQPILGIGVGGNQSWQAGGSLSADFPLNDSLMLGASAASSLGGALNYDVRGMYRFVVGTRSTGPSIAAVVGLWGQPGLPYFQTSLGAAPFIGFAMAYPITDRFTARLDLSYAPFFDYAHASQSLVFLGGPPSSGLEVGYKVAPNLEATLGLNGRGDFLGANFQF